ncbi:hypothetical protein ACWEQL_01960 [Kitasatospora sp. NPDC004240]
MTCLEIAADWRRPLSLAEDISPAELEANPIALVSRDSVLALYGLHLHTAHPDAVPPVPQLAGCQTCWTLVAYVEEHGSGAAQRGVTVGHALRQHLLGHLVEVLLV